MGFVGPTYSVVSGAITSADIADGSITNDDISSSAAIAMSKTALAGGTGITLSTNTLSVDASQTQITAVGTLDAGAISSGFGNIDIGSSTFDTTGAINIGNLTTAGYVNFSTKNTPSDPGTEEARMYIDEVDTNNNALYVKIQKAGTMTEVEITSPWLIVKGERIPTRDIEIDVDKGVLRSRSYYNGVYEAKLQFEKVGEGE